MKLSIVIITCNTINFLHSCLTSLQNTLAGSDTELILVDNGSTDETISFIESHYPKTKLIKLAENKGVAYARNRGIEQAKGNYILLLDSDTISNHEAIIGMVRYMNENSEVGVCGCRLVSPKGAVQDSFKKYPAIGYKLNNLLIALSGRWGMKRWEKRLLKQNEQHTYGNPALICAPFSPDYLIGACQMIRKEVFEEIGLLDEKIFFGPEDADFCIRAARRGWKIVYLPTSQIVHHWQRSTSKKLFSALTFKHIQALFYFYRKNRCELLAFALTFDFFFVI